MPCSIVEVVYQRICYMKVGKSWWPNIKPQLPPLYKTTPPPQCHIHHTSFTPIQKTNPATTMKGAAMVAMLFIIATNSWTGSMAQSSCTNVLISMSPCLDYIQGNSSKPSSSCCSQLANVVRSNPQCLCQVLNGGASSLGVSVNQTQAMALPTACNVKTPPASQCNGNQIN